MQVQEWITVKSRFFSARNACIMSLRLPTGILKEAVVYFFNDLTLKPFNVNLLQPLSVQR